MLKRKLWRRAACLCGTAASSADHLRHELHEFPDVLFSRVERAHPPHNALLLDPGIKEVPLFNLLNSRLRNLSKNAVRLHLPDDPDLRDLSQFGLQHESHAVCM